MKKQTPKQLTIGALRSSFTRSRARGNTIKRNRISRGLYKCEKCGHEGKVKEFQVDHIDPVMKCDDWNNIVERFWDEENLQLLCKPCHKVKTKEDRAQMREKKNGKRPTKNAGRKSKVDDQSGTLERPSSEESHNPECL